MGRKRRKFSAEFKTSVALEALRGQKTLNEIARDSGVHPNQVSAWKRQAQEGLVAVMEDGRANRSKEGEALIEDLYQQIGRQKVEIDWLKKKFGIGR